MHPATAGRVHFDGRDITRLRPHQIARLGLARTFQIVQPFPEDDGAGERRGRRAVRGRRAPASKDALARRASISPSPGSPIPPTSPPLTLTLAQRKRLELAKGLAMKPRS